MDVRLTLLLKMSSFHYENSSSKNFKHGTRNNYGFSPFGFPLYYTLDSILTVVIIMIIFITHEMSRAACSSGSQGNLVPNFCSVISLKWLAVMVLTERD